MTTSPPARATDRVPRKLVVASEVTWRLAIVVIGAIGVAWLFLELRLVTVPAVIALLATSVMHPVVEVLRRRGWPDLLATWAVVAAGTAIVAGFVLLVVPPIVDQAADFDTQLDGGVAEVEDWLQTGPLGLDGIDLQQGLDRGLDRLLVSRHIVEGVTLAGEVLAGVLLAIVMTFFFTKDAHRITDWLAARVPPGRRDAALTAGRAAWSALGAYVRGTAIVGLVNGTIIGVGLALIGVPFALPLAVITAVSAFFPIVGAVVAGAIAALVALFAGGPLDAALVIGLVVIVQQVEGDVLSPVVMGRALRLHPLVILVALTIGAVTAGFLGAFLAVPLAGVVAAALGSTGEHPPPERAGSTAISSSDDPGHAV